MKFAPSVFTFALISAFAVTASAQTAASAPSRADVKAETAAAKKAGALPMDSGPDSTKGQSMPKKPKAEADRAAVKGDTQAAAKAGAMPVQTGAGSDKAQSMPKKPKSEADRGAVKSEAAAANKAGTIPSGQESIVGQDKGAASAPKKK
jgi:Domain of unknown function (DUF4148)